MRDFWWKKQNKSKKLILSMQKVTVKLQNYLLQLLVRLVRVWLNLEESKLLKKLQILWPIPEMWFIYPKANRPYCPYPNKFSEKTFFVFILVKRDSLSLLTNFWFNSKYIH